MATSQMGNVIQQLHKSMLVQEAPDGQLLESFVNRRDAAALEALVRRHGPMVWNVCRRVLHNQQDAEDAFQATFLVFVRKAAAIVPREMVGNWLYGVAHQTALKANATTAKRRTREKQVTQMPEPAMTEQQHWTDLQPILDQEISRLSDHYRVVIVLCDLEGKTRSQAALQLGWPEGTVAGRLARARTALAKRLSQRGIVLSGGALAALLSQQAAAACVPGAVVTTTIQTATLVASAQAAAMAAVPAKVAALTEGVVKAMLLAKLKFTACVLLLVSMAAFTCGMLAFGMTNANGDDVDKPAAQANEQPKAGVGDKADTLTVTIKPQQNRIRVNEAFKVDLRVVNTSKSTQSFRVMNCSWDEHWQSSNKRIGWDRWDCAENSAETVKLGPGEAYVKTLPMLLAAGKPQEKVSFKMGFTPIDSKQTFWSNEVTVQVDPDKKAPRFVPIASYPSQDRVADKRIRELLDAAKITFISVGSRGLTASVAEDKAKQARAILEKAVVDETLSVQVLDQLPVPKKLRAVRTDSKLRIEEDSASIEEVIVPVAAGLSRACYCELSVYRGKVRVSHTGGSYTPPFEFTRANSKIPQPGESYEVELVVRWFETDAPDQPNWAPESGGKYKVLVTRTLKLSVEPDKHEQAAAAIKDLGGWAFERKNAKGELETTAMLLEASFSGNWRGGDDALKLLKDLRNLTHVEISARQITDAGMIQLKDLGNLKTLRLACPKVSDAGLKHLQALPLETLSLDGMITEAGLGQLPLGTLKSLTLEHANVADLRLKDWPHLKDLHFASDRPTRVHVRGLPALEILNLNAQKVSEVHITNAPRLQGLNLANTTVEVVRLSGLEKLRTLNLQQTKVSDAELTLAGLAHLETLKLGQTTLGDAALAQVKDSHELTRVELQGTKITDEGLKHLQGSKNLEFLSLGGPDITGAGLASLKALKLKALHLHGHKVTDAGLAHLKGMTSLRELYLWHTRISDAGLEYLQGLRDLRFLFLDQTDIGDPGLKHLRELRELEVLLLNRTKTTDAGLEHLKNLTKLKRLGLNDVKITDKGLVHLKNMARLEWLELWDADVTDAGLVHLSGLKSLKQLDLQGTKVTDAGLVHLPSLTCLQGLNWQHTKITPAGVNKLMQAWKALQKP